MKLAKNIKIQNNDHRMLVFAPKKKQPMLEGMIVTMPQTCFIKDYKKEKCIDLDQFEFYFHRSRKKIPVDQLEMHSNGRCFLIYELA